MRKSLLVHLQLSKLSVKANFNFEPQVGNPTTGMKSYQDKGKTSDKKTSNRSYFFGLGTDKVKTVFKP